MNATLTSGIIHKLNRSQQRIVLAESCTGGLVAAQLTSIPGASMFICGSMVAYRDATKRDWLGVAAEKIEKYSSVSSEVTLEMASAALSLTAEASLAVAITGHLGPDVPKQLDGKIFIAVACRDPKANGTRALIEDEHQLRSGHREARQVEAAERTLHVIEKILDKADLTPIGD
ncbi:MAG: damage-inducible protein [Planctomycetaceae bacterium]|nr:damage-inducible protein [Planctomycetaceae bacterium]|tara:strand:+ start:87 stop:608 length:522 start_codon:yes stop_codon:yes gene_type:complete